MRGRRRSVVSGRGKATAQRVTRVTFRRLKGSAGRHKAQRCEQRIGRRGGPRVRPLPEGGEDHGTVSADQATTTPRDDDDRDRKSTRLNSSHVSISYAVLCLKKNR